MNPPRSSSEPARGSPATQELRLASAETPLSILESLLPGQGSTLLVQIAQALGKLERPAESPASRRTLEAGDLRQTTLGLLLGEGGILAEGALLLRQETALRCTATAALALLGGPMASLADATPPPQATALLKLSLALSCELLQALSTRPRGVSMSRARRSSLLLSWERCIFLAQNTLDARTSGGLFGRAAPNAQRLQRLDQLLALRLASSMDELPVEEGLRRFELRLARLRLGERAQPAAQRQKDARFLSASLLLQELPPMLALLSGQRAELGDLLQGCLEDLSP